ncbi:MAG TPA: hypothetical protein VGN15_09475, partial [Ktedonobacteraceae bacterium]|nr:hypothetical protein [Ktedonobacteraceae bacterium]
KALPSLLKDDNAEYVLVVVPPLFTALLMSANAYGERPHLCLVTGATVDAYRAGFQVDFASAHYCVAPSRSSL